MWSDLVEKNMSRIADGKGFYIDGGINLDYRLKRQVNEDPYETEAIDATNPEFHKRINEMRQYRYQEIGRSIVYARDPKQDPYMTKYYKKQARTITRGEKWFPDLYFWNLEENRPDCDFDIIDKTPTEWYIVNVDVHH